MLLTKAALTGLGISALLVSGCTSERFAPYQGANRGGYHRPAPIRAAPMEGVSQSQLPPLENADYPQWGEGDDSVQVAAVDPARAMELSPATVAGVWKASVDGMPCQIATPMTKFGQGYRAGAMRCPAALSDVNSWAVSGSQLIFYNRDGQPQATLYSSSGSSFVGRTGDGVQIILTR